MTPLEKLVALGRPFRIVYVPDGLRTEVMKKRFLVEWEGDGFMGSDRRAAFGDTLDEAIEAKLIVLAVALNDEVARAEEEFKKAHERRDGLLKKISP